MKNISRSTTSTPPAIHLAAPISCQLTNPAIHPTAASLPAALSPGHAEHTFGDQLGEEQGVHTDGVDYTVCIPARGP